MATFQRITTVEARQYDGPRLVVVHDELGEQVAVSGDYLLGSERGKISVMSAAKFEKDFELWTPTPDAEQITADETEIADLKKKVDELQAANLQHEGDNLHLSGMLADANARIGDEAALKAQITALTGELEAEKSKSADLDAKLTALVNAESTRASAQAQMAAAETVVNENLSH